MRLNGVGAAGFVILHPQTETKNRDFRHRRQYFTAGQTTRG